MMIICGLCSRPNVLSGRLCTAFSKRKLRWLTVSARAFRHYDTYATLIDIPKCQPFLMRGRYSHSANMYLKESSLISRFCKNKIHACLHKATCVTECRRCTQSDSVSSEPHKNDCCGENLDKIKMTLLDACILSKMREFVSPKQLAHHQNVRHLSRRRRHINKGNHDDDDEEEKRQRLRGAVMYVSNPLTWISKKWNVLKLKHKLDPSFSESEFLFGARQAITHVSQMVSTGKFDQLSGLVVEEVIDWLMTFRNSLASTEREALALGVDDVVLMKIRYVHLGSEQDTNLAFVDSVCFGLRMFDSVPYFVDLGIRFRRDYSTDPPSDWVVAGISHIRMQNLATD